MTLELFPPLQHAHFFNMPHAKSNRWQFIAPKLIAAIGCLSSLSREDVPYITFSVCDNEGQIIGFVHTKKLTYPMAFKDKDKKKAFWSDTKKAFKSATFYCLDTNSKVLDTLMEIQLKPHQTHDVHEFGDSKSTRFNGFVEEISLFKAVVDFTPLVKVKT